jgi:hypothetical protein
MNKLITKKVLCQIRKKQFNFIILKQIYKRTIKIKIKIISILLIGKKKKIRFQIIIKLIESLMLEKFKMDHFITNN